MSILGISDMKRFAIPAGWDAGVLEKYRLADGTTYDALVGDIAAALSQKAQMMQANPQYGSLVSFTEELAVEYRNGTTKVGMEERTENRRADPKRGATVGHMLPIKSFDRSLSWTWDFLRVARRRQLDSDIIAAMYDVEDEFQRRTLTRFFSSAENAVGGGGTGFDMPLANASTSVPYTPPAYNGKTFASTHTHFARDTTANRLVAIKAGVLHLLEHGIVAPWNGIVPQSLTATYTALAGFIKPDRQIQHFLGQSDARVGNINEQVFIGGLETDYGILYLWETPRVTTDHFGLYKSYGNNDPRNPVVVRTSPDLGEGPVLKAGTQIEEFPLENAYVIHEYGCGIEGEQNLARLNGYAIYFNASGNYVDPTIS